MFNDPKKFRRRVYKCRDLNNYDEGDRRTQSPLHEMNEDGDYNLVSSKLSIPFGRGLFLNNELHAPVFDVDIPCRYVKSSTEGHGHLYFDSLRLTWPQYVALLGALASAGIISPAYFSHSVDKGMTTVRPPHVRKKVTGRKAKEKKPLPDIGGPSDGVDLIELTF